MRSVHSKEKPFPCEICGFRSSRVDNLNIHRIKVHSLPNKITRTQLQELVSQGKHPFCSNPAAIPQFWTRGDINWTFPRSEFGVRSCTQCDVFFLDIKVFITKTNLIKAFRNWSSYFKFVWCQVSVPKNLWLIKTYISRKIVPLCDKGVLIN